MSIYKYSYQVALTTVRKDETFDFTADMLDESYSVKSYITDKIIEFSNMSRNSVRNSKYVDEKSIHIMKDSISFIMHSENELPVVGRCVRLLSQLLLSESYFANLLVNNKLFKTYIPTESVNEITGEVEMVDVSAVVSDTDLIKALIDYLIVPQFPYTKEKNEINFGIKEMKAIAVKTGLIKI